MTYRKAFTRKRETENKNW